MPRRELESRPENFFGPDDYTGGDPNDDIERITRLQAEWDARRAAMPWYLRLVTLKA